MSIIIHVLFSYPEIYWCWCNLAHQKMHSPIKGVLGTGTTRKGGLRNGSNSKKEGLLCVFGKKVGLLLRHIPVLDMYVSAPPCIILCLLSLIHLHNIVMVKTALTLTNCTFYHEMNINNYFKYWCLRCCYGSRR